MSLQHIKLKPLFYPKSKNGRYFTKISNLQQKWEQTHLQSPEQNMIGEMEKEKSTRAAKGSSSIYSIKYRYISGSFYGNVNLSVPSHNRNITLENTWLHFLYIF